MALLAKRVRFGDKWTAKDAWSAVAAISEYRSPAVDGRGGRHSVKIILGLDKAADIGKVVKLSLTSDPVLAARKMKA